MFYFNEVTLIGKMVSEVKENEERDKFKFKITVLKEYRDNVNPCNNFLIICSEKNKVVAGAKKYLKKGKFVLIKGSIHVNTTKKENGFDTFVFISPKYIKLPIMKYENQEDHIDTETEIEIGIKEEFKEDKNTKEYSVDELEDDLPF